MPDPNRLPWRIDDRLAGMTLGALIEQRAVIVIDCDSCPNVARWTAKDMERRFHRQRHLTLREIGPKLRCSKCRSEWVRIARNDRARPL
ncbi:MAG TPA: hypothetical protein VHY34_13145 [Caulobacteraceae bacterium]|jgi:hypothetical protein|nr:hypothetical protein [Caulobacteraceae bacterium]